MHSTAKFVVGVPLGVFALWQGAYVTYDIRRREGLSNKLTPQRQRFYIGSTDDMIMDSLTTGDVLLYKHPWYKQRPRAALRSLISGREPGETVFDHCALVVRRRSVSSAEVLEWTDNGVKLTTFDKHLLNSGAESVWLRRRSDKQLSDNYGGHPQSSNLDGTYLLRAAHSQGLCGVIDDKVVTKDESVDVSGDFCMNPSLGSAGGLLGLVQWVLSRTNIVASSLDDPSAKFVAAVLATAHSDLGAAVAEENTVTLHDLSANFYDNQSLPPPASGFLGSAFPIRSQ